MSAAMAELVALLRGINLGPHKRVKMADLRAALEEMGHEDVRTHLQSGNVVLRTDKPARQVAADVQAAAGFELDVMIRTAAELRRVYEGNPFPEAGDGKKLHVAFLAGRPRDLDLDPAAFEPERWRVSGEEIYIWLPGGMQNSPLMKALSERRIGVSATVRNWNTVTALHELLG